DVGSGGDVYVVGRYVDGLVGGVRPALKLNLEDALFTSDNTATGGKSAVTTDGNFVELTTSNNIKFTMLDNSLELASITPTARDGDTITFDYNGATAAKTLSAVVMRDGEVAYYGKLVDGTDENGTDVELTLPDDYNSATDKVQVFVEEANGVNETDFASAFVELGDPCDYGVHDYDEQEDCTVKVDCKDCGLEMIEEKEHDYGKQTDCKVAVNCNDCGLRMIEEKEHVYDEQTDCTVAVNCNDCGLRMIGAKPHNPKEEDCTECEYCPASLGTHDYDEQTDLTKAVYCKVCSFEVFAELPPIEVDIVNGKVQIRNNTNGFFSTKGLYLTDGENKWALPVVVVRARSAVVIGGRKRGKIGGLTGDDIVLLVS
ncbi:MAG: hypothetical protein FWH07_07375, partial [Oscillospiraceae bacterium]|nr:hypothetical protein [Oscillospiraceae bacterium]